FEHLVNVIVVVIDSAVVMEVRVVRPPALRDEDWWVVEVVTCPSQDIAQAPRVHFQPISLSTVLGPAGVRLDVHVLVLLVVLPGVRSGVVAHQVTRVVVDAQKVI
ncbi:hypothetical protein EGW08_016210, partial [Elysia chlorotica]